VRWRDFDGVSWGRDHHDLDSHTENKATDNELCQCHATSNYNGTDDDNPCADEHALATSKLVGNNSTERGSDDRTTEKILCQSYDVVGFFGETYTV
jgi:hypothetical protein